MHLPSSARQDEKLSGIVERVTFHSAETGWSVLQVSPFRDPASRVAVVVHQVKVFAGASMDFVGEWKTHPKYGEQFACHQAIERKPASAAALEKYLGSGLIRGVGPKTARKIVAHFGEETLAVFDGGIERLSEVRGIAARKLETIAASWREHRAIRDVMMFLQQHGISTLFAVKIFAAYGDAAIDRVRDDPYRLAKDIYGIGFFSADRIAASLGFDPHGAPRLDAGIRHVLDASREEGHCFLTADQVRLQTTELLGLASADDEAARVERALAALVDRGEIRTRLLEGVGEDVSGTTAQVCYYARSLFRAEESVARLVRQRLGRRIAVDRPRVDRWLDAHARRTGVALSDAQRAAVLGVTACPLSVLTGGPGCGKTTTTRAIVALARAMGQHVILGAPTGRAAQRLQEVVGREAKTLHRLLEWNPATGRFSHDAEHPLRVDFLVVDETSMLDITLAAALLEALPREAQILFVGDPDQLPSVGAGDLLADLLRARAVPRFALTEVFRQAQTSAIVRHAHEIQRGVVPEITSPIAEPAALAPEALAKGTDCLFLDAEEATQAQLRFLRRAKAAIERTRSEDTPHLLVSEGRAVGEMRSGGQGIEVVRRGAVESADEDAPRETLTIPRKLLSVDLEKLARTESGIAEIRAVLRRLHPHSTLRHGLSLVDAIRRLYTKTIPERLGPEAEVQVLAPMNRGSVGAAALNAVIQEAVTPARVGRAEIRAGDRVFRVGDRVIQRRNNYHLGVFNGDIGQVVSAAADELRLEVAFRSGGGEQIVPYTQADLVELSLAYAITVHKSQGSEFDAVILPIATQHFRMLFRGLVYTGLTRAKKLAVLVGERAALARAVENTESRRRQTALDRLLG